LDLIITEESIGVVINTGARESDVNRKQGSNLARARVYRVLKVVVHERKAFLVDTIGVGALM
jgi:hypothetical protein